jgi:hypothetical protein
VLPDSFLRDEMDFEILIHSSFNERDGDSLSDGLFIPFETVFSLYMICDISRIKH